MIDWVEKARQRLGLEGTGPDPDRLPPFGEDEAEVPFEKYTRAKDKTVKTAERVDIHPLSNLHDEAVFSSPEGPGYFENRTVKTVESPETDKQPLQEAGRAIIDGVARSRPPDVSDTSWAAALRGLRAFLEAGHGAEAERLGWPKNELYAVPPVWARVDLCGAGLLIGDNEVTGVTAVEIRVKTASGSSLAFYRKPQPNLRLVYASQLKLRRCDDAAGDEEARLRAFEFTVAFHRERTGCDVATATQAVTTALAQTVEGTTP
jgi:hypothetical protein